MIADPFLGYFQKVKQTGDGKWVACCPVHEDKTPSMSITEANDSVLMHCHSCGANGKDVCDALGLDSMMLFGEEFKPGEYKKPKIPAADILRCLDFEVLFLSMVNKQLTAGQPLREEDRDRLKLTDKRISAAIQAGGIR